MQLVRSQLANAIARGKPTQLDCTVYKHESSVHVDGVQRGAVVLVERARGNSLSYSGRCPVKTAVPQAVLILAATHQSAFPLAAQLYQPALF